MRLAHQLVCGDGDELGVGVPALQAAQYRVTDSETEHVGTDRHDFTGEIAARRVRTAVQRR